MGGKKKRGIGGIASSIGNAVVKGTTGGAASIDGTGWAERVAKGEIKTTGDAFNAATDGAISAAGGAGLMEANKIMNPELSLPEAPDVAAQEAAAEEEARKKIATVGKGVSATILGGSLGDSSGLRKKKLLGE